MMAIAYITRQGLRYRRDEPERGMTLVLHGCGVNSVARM
jgi:hypothetical protein